MGIEAVEARLLALAKDYDPLKSNTLIALDPFQGAYNQRARMRAFCVVILNGTDITNKLEPHLISVRIVDGDELQCEIEVDDRDALVPIPPIGAKVKVDIGWAREQMFRTFDGEIKDVEYGIGRKQGGRRMWIHANGFGTTKSKMKEPMQMNLGEGAPPGDKEGQKHGLNDWIGKLAAAGGGSAQISSAFAAIKQDYWGAMSASPIHQIIQEGLKVGAMVQGTAGNVINFEKPGERGVSCRAVYRDNLIGCRLKPFAARPVHGASQSDSFDAKKGEIVKSVMTGLTEGKGPAAGVEAAGGAPGPEATQGNSEQANQGAADGQDGSGLGHGRIVIQGEPRATWNSLVTLVGVRPGVDGNYIIQVAEHIYSRQGYVTWLDVTPDGSDKSTASVLGNWPLPNPNPNII